MPSQKDSMFSSAGCYRIEVHGRLEKEWAGRLGSLQVFSYIDDDGSGYTVLMGDVIDQAELAGILKTLYELHLSIRSVNLLGGKRL